MKSFILISFLISTIAALPQLISPQRTLSCNGSPALCDRSYGNVTFFGAHDSFAVDDVWWNPVTKIASDQNVPVLKQLGLGIRFLQGQVHLYKGQMRLCHTTCTLLDGGLLLDYLKTVKGWLDDNPDEVLTLLLNNPDRQNVMTVWKPLYEEAGLAQYAYSPPKAFTAQTDWPTLGEMIISGRRLVIFMDYGDDGWQVPWILPEFTNIWEPPFDAIDPTFPCSVSRITGNASDHMYMLNHNLDSQFPILKSKVDLIWPARSQILITNSYASIMQNAIGCSKFADGRWPNFILLDFVDKGSWMNAYRFMNNLI